MRKLWTKRSTPSSQTSKDGDLDSTTKRLRGMDDGELINYLESHLSVVAEYISRYKAARQPDMLREAKLNMRICVMISDELLRHVLPPEAPRARQVI